MTLCVFDMDVPSRYLAGALSWVGRYLVGTSNFVLVTREEVCMIDLVVGTFLAHLH